MKKFIKIKMTRKEAVELGLLVCTCGWPENNHWEHGKKTNPMNSECKGYREVARRGKIIK